MPQLRTKHWIGIAFMVFGWLLWATPTLGATRTWTGGAGNNNWATPGNWGGTTPVAGDDLVFPTGAARLSNTNNLAAGTSFNSITISGSGYTVAGNSIALAAGNLSDTNAAGSNTISLAISMAATRTFSISNAAETLTISGVISGAGGLTKTGSGTLTLSASNSYTGLTTISAGTLKLGAAGGATNTPLGTTGAGTTVSAGAALDLNGFTLGTAEALTLNGTGVASGGALTNSSATAATYSGLITLGSASSIVASSGNIIVSNAGTITGSGFGLTLDGTSAASSIASIIGTGAGTVTKSGTGTWTVSGANTYTGLTTISAGTLQLGANNSVPSGSAVTATGTFDLAGFNDAIGSLSGGGTVTNSSATNASTLTTGGDNTSTTFSGVIQDGNQQVLLTKAGTGRMTLSGVNTYTGATAINGGVLSIAADNNLGAAPGSATPGQLAFGGGTLQTTATFTLSSNRGIAFNSTGTIDVASSTTLTYGGIAAGAGGLTKTSPGALTLAGNNTYTGTTTVSAGMLLVNGSQSGSAVNVDGGTLGGTGTVGAITSTVSGGTVSTGSLDTSPGILNSGNLNLAAAGTRSFVVQPNGTTAGSGYDQLNVTGTVNLTGAALTATVGFTPAVGNTFTIINNDSADAVTGTFAGLAQGATVTLSGVNFIISYTGGTGNDVVLSRVATTFTWDGGGADNNWTTAANWVGNVAPVAGDDLVFDSTGVGVRPLPNNDFAAATNFGTITVAVGGYTLGGNSLILATDLTASNASGSSTVSLIVGGTATVTRNGAGTLVLSGANSFSGATSINA